MVGGGWVEGLVACGDCSCSIIGGILAVVILSSLCLSAVLSVVEALVMLVAGAAPLVVVLAAVAAPCVKDNSRGVMMGGMGVALKELPSDAIASSIMKQGLLHHAMHSQPF